MIFSNEVELCKFIKYITQVNNIPLFLTFEHIHERKLMCFLI